MSVLDVNSITKSFGKNVVLKDIEFNNQTNQILGIFGRNGCGKSTLLKILFGSLGANSYSIAIDKKTYHPNENIGMPQIAYLPQDNFLPQNIKVRNVIPMYFGDEEDMDRLFYDPTIAKFEGQLVRNLSMGQKRYLEVMMISRLPQNFIMLDEPFSMIEPIFQEAIKELLVSIKTTKGIILTDHYYFDVMDVTDKNLLIKEGKSIVVQNENDLASLGYLSKVRQ